MANPLLSSLILLLRECFSDWASVTQCSLCLSVSVSMYISLCLESSITPLPAVSLFLTLHFHLSFLFITEGPLRNLFPYNLFSLPLSSSSNMSAHQAPLLPLLFHGIILAFRQQQTDKLVCLLLSSFPLLLLLTSFLLLFWVWASSNEQSSSSPGQSKQNQSHIPRAQFAVTSQLCELGVFKLEVWRSSWVASGC